MKSGSDLNRKQVFFYRKKLKFQTLKQFVTFLHENLEWKIIEIEKESPFSSCEE